MLAGDEEQDEEMWGACPPPLQGCGGCSRLIDVLPPLCALLGRLGPPAPPSSGLLSTSAPRRVPTMPVVGVLLWATLLTLGWRATHAKDHGFATPRVQLSFKGKSPAEGVGEQGGTPRRRRGRGVHRSRLLLLTWGRWEGPSAGCTPRNPWGSIPWHG